MLSKKNIPTHVAIIMDGNRRWAKMHGKTTVTGHKAGFKAIKEIVRHANNLGIKFLSLFAFSTENWQRSNREVDLLMRLFTTVLESELAELMQENVRIIHIGRKDRIPKRLSAVISNVEKVSANNQGITVFLALDYGGRDEIIRAVNRLLETKPGLEKVTDEALNSQLDTAKFPDPDLIIRTSGEMRLSNFLVWQSAYSEFIFVEDLMPDFTPKKFDLALEQFFTRQRRYGN